MIACFSRRRCPQYTLSKHPLTRFGFRYLDTLLRNEGRAIEVVNQTENETEDLVGDLTAIVYSFCARLYGQRRAMRKTQAIVRELEANEAQANGAAGRERCN